MRVVAQNALRSLLLFNPENQERRDSRLIIPVIAPVSNGGQPRTCKPTLITKSQLGRKATIQRSASRTTRPTFPSRSSAQRQSKAMCSLVAQQESVNLRNVLYRTVTERVEDWRHFWPNSSMRRRLEDRIRDLCAEALAAQEAELGPTLSKLRSALHEHNERIRRLFGARLFSAENGHREERRSL
jgi:hypothetical protein